MPFTNYETLKKTGQLTPYAFIVDTTPLGKITIGDYLNMPIPKYWTKEEKARYWENRYKKILSYAECDTTLKERQQKYKHKQIIKKRVDMMVNPFYVTIMPDNVNLDLKTLERKIKKKMNDLKIKYVLLSDYGDNGRLHFHGFVDMVNYMDYFAPTESLDNSYFKFGIARKSKKTKKTALFYTFKPFLDVGFCNVSVPNDTKETINYITKYITKDLKNQGYKHKVIACRMTEEEKQLKNNLILKNALDKIPFLRIE